MIKKITKVKLAYQDGLTPDYFFPKKYDNHKRFILGRKGTNPLVVIGMNPSAASEEYSDRTVNKIIRVSRQRNHEGWFMLNIYPERATNQNDLDDYSETLSRENCAMIIDFLLRNNIKEVWGAWGNLEHNSLLKGKQMLLGELKKNGISIYHFDKLTQKGNPRHPLYMNKKLFEGDKYKNKYEY